MGGAESVHHGSISFAAIGAILDTIGKANLASEYILTAITEAIARVANVSNADAQKALAVFLSNPAQAGGAIGVLGGYLGAKAAFEVAKVLELEVGDGWKPVVGTIAGAISGGGVALLICWAAAPPVAAATTIVYTAAAVGGVTGFVYGAMEIPKVRRAIEAAVFVAHSLEQQLRHRRRLQI